MLIFDIIHPINFLFTLKKIENEKIKNIIVINKNLNQISKNSKLIIFDFNIFVFKPKSIPIVLNFFIRPLLNFPNVHEKLLRKISF